MYDAGDKVPGLVFPSGKDGSMIKSRNYLMIWLIAVVLATGCSAGELEIVPDETGLSAETGETVQPTDAAPEILWVYVCGEVACPGVYELPAGSRIFEAVEAAGGLTSEASSVSVNLAETVSDGQKIYIPDQDEAKTCNAAAGETEDGRVHLNTATQEELMTLPGIGPSKASAIIRYREENGGFSSTEQLMEVSGIKTATYEQIEDLVTID